MTTTSDGILSLWQALQNLLDKESSACQSAIDAAIKTLGAVRGSSQDRRLQKVESNLRDARDKLELSTRIATDDMLVKLREACGSESPGIDENPILDLLKHLTEPRVHGRAELCQILLDRLMETCHAARGYIVFYLPESTEAEVICTREFRTKSLGLEEYQCSRTLLLEALQQGKTLRVANASQDTRYARQESVRDLMLRSVLIVPMSQGSRTIGAVYLENRSLANAFTTAHARSAELATQVFTCCLHHAGIIPTPLDPTNRVILDAHRAGWEIIGGDKKLLAVLDTVQRVADLPITVLVEGESGTGKELVARALHHASTRRKGPFVAINCASIHGELAESELFGHEKGAFTGAIARHSGCFEQAQEGTLFLDEINELAFPIQAKLLRVLERQEIKRLGGGKNIPIDVRVVAASSRSLKSLSKEGHFQAPLYHRLNAIRVELPPLRERKCDIEMLTNFFFAKYSEAFGRSLSLSKDAYDAFGKYSYPGNVRELENIVRRLVALADDGAVIGVGDLPLELREHLPKKLQLHTNPIEAWSKAPASDLTELQQRESQAHDYFAAEKRRLVDRVIEEEGGVTAAARKLKLNRVTLHKIRRSHSSK